MSDHTVASAWSRLSALTKARPETVGPIRESLCLFLSQLRGPVPDQSSARLSTTAERQRVETRLMGFDVNRSPAWQDIRSRFGDSLNQAELLSLAEVIGTEIGVKVDREAKRRKEVLIKWFDENYPSIQNILAAIQMEDCDGKPMTGQSDRPN
jgi:hypothetical protein